MTVQGCDICLVINTIYKILDYLVSDPHHSCFIPEKIHCINCICLQAQVKDGEAPVQVGQKGRAIFTYSAAGKWLFLCQTQVNKCIFTLLTEDRYRCV